ncbi:MAG TPA: response regulator [Flavobacterium sp.]|jgi:CheY-like chemotaxis protein
MQPLKILLVEDNEGDIILTLEALKEGQTPKEISVVKDGWEALVYIEKSGKDFPEPDIILLDVNLPKVNGHEVLTKIKSDPKKRHIPVLMLTTSSSLEDITKSYQNNADRYIAKPVNAEDFLRVVNSVEEFWSAHQNKK